MTRTARVTLAVAAATLAMAACSKPQPLAPELERAMKARHEGFEAMGDAFKKIADTLKGGGSLNPELAAAAATVSERAGQLVDWFPAGTGPESGRKTEAKAEIWQQPSLFSEKREALVAEAGKLAALAQAGDAGGFSAQVREVGGTCKGCHDTFRAKDD